MSPEELSGLLNKFRSGEASPEEESAILKWYDRIQFSQSMKMDEEEKARLQENVWSRIQPSRKVIPFRPGLAHRFPMVVKIAAAVLLLITLAGIMYLITPHNLTGQQNLALYGNDTTLITIVNSEQLTRIVALEDGSKISLQPNSQLQYPHHFKAGRREVYLKGEAFFEIARDTTSPFLVYTHDVTTKVLGTSFTIKAHENMKQLLYC